MSADPQNPPSPSLSSPQSQPLDLSLVRAFGALETALVDLTASSRNNNLSLQRLTRQVSSLAKQIVSRALLDDKHRESIIQALIELTTSFDRLAQQEGIAVGATVNARDALVAAKEEINRQWQAVKEEVKEATGQHPLLPRDPNGTPEFIEKIILHLANFGWKNKAKVAGWVLIAGTSLWHAIEQIAPWFK